MPEPADNFKWNATHRYELVTLVTTTQYFTSVGYRNKILIGQIIPNLSFGTKCSVESLRTQCAYVLMFLFIGISI